MKNLFISFLCCILRVLFRLRYNVKIEGKEFVKKKSFVKKGGVLFLPNHPAHIDPVLITLFFWPKFRFHPLVVEYVYRQSFINIFMKLIGALSIPNLESGLNEIKMKNAEGIIQTLIHGLKEKKNYLLYPSGRLKHTGKEILGAASALHTIVNQNEDVNLVLIRTTGLWGSSFSRAYEQRSPNIKTMMIKGILSLLKCGVFFMPRRKVLIQISLAPKNFPLKGSRLEINRYLEKWYNQYPSNGNIEPEEPLNRVSYSCWKKVFLDAYSHEKKQILEKKKFSSKIEEEVFKELQRIHPDAKLQLDMNLATDLGMDSLDIAEIINFLSVHYDIGEIHPEEFETVQDVLEVAEGREKKREKKEKQSDFHWPKELKRLPPELPIGKTIPEAFFNTCDRMKGSIACADDVIGPLTYKKLKIAVLILSKEMKKMPGEKIGVLFPASVAAYIIILAIMCANKVPVMLNWTLGPRYLNNMMQITNAKAVISSWRFLEKLSNVEFGHLIQDIHLLEDIRKKITKKDKAKAFLLSLKKSKGLLKELNLDKKSENDTAVTLFTSGTEAIPKGVPLSHNNILSNQRSAMQCTDLNAKDVIYGILPPFHSFGFSVAGLLPILAGMRAAYYPDPTDSFSLAEGIERWGITIFCSAPSFLRGLLNVSTKNQLKMIRLFITGAEKTSQDLYDRVKKIGEDKKIVEGYGITECSPILTINRPNRPPCGVGQLVPGVDLCTIDPETLVLLKEGQEGEMCVRGENVFSGYLGAQKSPFIRINNENWYKTGDLGYRDEKGNIILSGRLKRFTKIGGEMVSLTGLETIISSHLFQKDKEEPEIAICSKESDGDKSKLILFTTVPLEKSDINVLLKEAGFSRLVKISEIKRIDQIPLLGTGKTDYRFLQTLLE